MTSGRVVGTLRTLEPMASCSQRSMCTSARSGRASATSSDSRSISPGPSVLLVRPSSQSALTPNADASSATTWPEGRRIWCSDSSCETVERSTPVRSASSVRLSLRSNMTARRRSLKTSDRVDLGLLDIVLDFVEYVTIITK